MFYTNNLAHTPSEDILHDTSEEAVCCVHGLGPLHCWVGTEMLNQTVFHVPAPIVAYNMFMNSVDIMDQRQSMNKMQQKEKRLNMTMFTLVLDLAIHNAFALYLWICEVENATEQQMSYHEFKQQIAVDLVAPYITQVKDCQKKQTVTDGVYLWMVEWLK